MEDIILNNQETRLYEADVLDYYKSFCNEAIYLGCLPALDDDHILANSYYSVGIKYQPSKNAAPTFYIPPVPWFGDGSLFVFDSESSRLEGTKETNPEMHQQILENIDKNPHVLFFKGCDDGSVGLRFPTMQSLYDYVNSLYYFEEVFQNERLQYYN